MHIEATLASRVRTRKSRAEHLLTAERVLMGVVLIACGLIGCFSLLSHPLTAMSAAQLSSTAFKAGAMLPLLKGMEVLLQLWANKAR